MISLPDVAESVIIRERFDTVLACDRQMDGQMDCYSSITLRIHARTSWGANHSSLLIIIVQSFLPNLIMELLSMALDENNTFPN